MKNTINTILLGIVLVAMCSSPVDAQSRRERREARKRAEERANHPYHRPVETVKKPVVTPKVQPPPRDYDYPETVLKDRYRIDVLAPLYLSELVVDGKVAVKGRLPDKVLPPLKFYEGIVLAADTLKKLGYKFDIFVYDVADELESPATLVNTDAFKGSDLILGILSSSDFPLVANYVKRNNVNFISALSPSNQSISDNPYFTMLQPSLETHCAALEAHIYQKHGNISPLLFYRDNISVDKIAMANFADAGAMTYKKVSCNVVPTQEDIQPLLNKTGKNVIVMPILSDKYAETIMTQLYQWFPDYEFEVWGMPSWDNMPSLKKSDAYPNVAVYYTSPFYFDATTASGQAVMQAYKKKYAGKADNMVFRGYETMFWYAYLLKKYGTIFNEHLWDNGGAPFTRYEIKPVYNQDHKLMYYENKHVYLYRYQSSSYMVEQ